MQFQDSTLIENSVFENNNGLINFGGSGIVLKNNIFRNNKSKTMEVDRKQNAIQQEYLKSVLLSQLLLEANESLFFTTQYKQQIKNKINSLNKDLEINKSEILSVFLKKTIFHKNPTIAKNILLKYLLFFLSISITIILTLYFLSS